MEKNQISMVGIPDAIPVKYMEVTESCVVDLNKYAHESLKSNESETKLKLHMEFFLLQMSNQHMRVLAVDDNPTCLKILESLLRKCQYQGYYNNNQAIIALNMLKENRNRFDLIISDVYMQDMDSLKLLELVGLEMGLPVIMLPGNGDRNLVMKGITHGACDYLVKPVRLEELRSIWQHVIRRKVDSKSQLKSKHNHEKSNQGNEGGDQNEKLNRKRNDDEENEAVPKRILDLMNVDGLTRESVASHLQWRIADGLPISVLRGHMSGYAAVSGLTSLFVALL
ncbi:putative response regulator and transcription factor RR-A-type family [Helianthus debilis subsp. tardiflorus]